VCVGGVRIRIRIMMVFPCARRVVSAISAQLVESAVLGATDILLLSGNSGQGAPAPDLATGAK